MKDLFAPDFTRLRRVLQRRGEPDRVPFFELFADTEIMAAILGRPVAALQDRIDYQVKLGYDFVTVWVQNMNFPTAGQGTAADTADLARAGRTFNLAGQGVIRHWADYERYPWPDPAHADYREIEEAARLMPEGMKAIVLTGHVLEMPMAIMGYEGLSLAVYDQPDLVEAVFQRVGETYLRIYRDLIGMDAVGAVFISDDLAFKTQTLMPPDFLRRMVFPWYRRYVEVCHGADVPVILHSCGNLSAVMDDLIACGLDAKHSYEDQILPVEEMKRRYGQSLAVLGGLDLDFLCRATPDEVRARTRRVLEACMPGGGYALGTGNSVANYLPVQNFLAMLEEGRRSGIYG
ncbi:MAG: uroporphyrinogen decarboxylase family protein [Bacteroidota bacterium]